MLPDQNDGQKFIDLVDVFIITEFSKQHYSVADLVHIAWADIVCGELYSFGARKIRSVDLQHAPHSFSFPYVSMTLVLYSHVQS